MQGSLMKLAYVGLAAVLLSACDLDTTLVVESDTVWAGTIDDRPVSGRGNTEFDIDGTVCWRLSKQSSAGILRAYAEKESTFGGSSAFGVQQTTSPGGVVEGCTP
jgi:hypothetical protein